MAACSMVDSANIVWSYDLNDLVMDSDLIGMICL
jgi:hypothetical protein